MKDVFKKAKEFAINHKNEIAIVGCIGAGIAGSIVIFTAGEEYAMLRVSNGLGQFDKLGFIDWKIPDGDGGFKIVDVDTCARYVQEHHDEIIGLRK